jgi:ribonucleoside-diphosphate reductase alpha chain
MINYNTKTKKFKIESIYDGDAYNSVKWVKRDAIIKNVSGEIIFEQRNVEFPDFWSETAINTVCDKYFAKNNHGKTETSLRELVHRVASTIALWGYEQKYYDKVSKDVFYNNLVYLVLNQYMAWNSPVWFNLGLDPHPMISACFIQSLEDSMDSIMDLARNEAKIFQNGGGTGTNFSSLRAKDEPLSKGGTASGPVSFMKGFDSFAGVVKSGGRCLAPWQKVYTTEGPIEVSKLENKEFYVLSFDPPSNRYKVKKAHAWKQDVKKEVLKLSTDKGCFFPTSDHPIKLNGNGDYVKTNDLKYGMSLFQCSVDKQDNYLRIHLRDGKKGRMKLHRMIAKDILNIDHSLDIHHINGNTLDNRIVNLQPLPRSEHSLHHSNEKVKNNEHIFQHQKYPHDNENNGMHGTSPFWKDDVKVKKYKTKQSKILINSNRAHSMQSLACKQKMINFAYTLINEGCDIDTFEKYCSSRENIKGRFSSKKHLLHSIEKNFGSYSDFYKELRDNNHKVLSTESLGMYDVFSVEVECPTLDDKTSNSGHNYVIWDGDSLTGSGIVVSNTRRAAKMIILNADHPDIEEFITCKVNEERRLRESSNGQNIDFNYAYKHAYFQNGNNSVRVTHDFMNAVHLDKEWETKNVVDGKTASKLSAKKLFMEMVSAAHECGDPGIQFDTTINDWNPLAGSGRINSSNPCLTGRSLISTSKGLKRLKSLVGLNDVEVTLHGKSVPVSKIWCSGNKPVYRVETKCGYYEELTEDHPVYTVNRGYVPTIELTTEDKVRLGGSGFGDIDLDTILAESIGFSVGDGCISNNILTLSGGESKKETLEYFNSYLNIVNNVRDVHVCPTDTGYKLAYNRKELSELFSKYAVLDKYSECKLFTDSIYSLNKNTVSSLLRGLFTADGTVSVCETNNNVYVGLDSTSLSLLEQVQILLLSFNIKSKLYKNRSKTNKKLLPDGNGSLKEYDTIPIHSLRITRSSRDIFEQEIGFCTSSPKFEKLRIANLKYSTYKDKHFDYVKSVTFLGNEDVYDMAVPNHDFFFANGIKVHNCSEYMSLDDTACNLASLNLMKFSDTSKNDFFNISFFLDACKLTLLSQEIMISKARYPTEKITEGANTYRQLGLGYANLGGLLMCLGYPYDSDEGRSVAAAITSLMTSTAYAFSIEMAKVVGPFEKFGENQKSFNKVLYGHKTHSVYQVKKLEDDLLSDKQKCVLKIAEKAWDRWEYCTGYINTYGIRNSQVSVLAPTGTIGFMLDVSTTGIEPDLSLVKTKSLVGGGTMYLVNKSVPLALRNLRYSEKDISHITQYVIDNGIIDGAPNFRKEHLPVFDCALAIGDRYIAPEGHVKMMAAVQPFLSGAISKTINVPNKCTVEEVYDLYFHAWKLGLKSLAIYRDGSKVFQPMKTKNTENKVEEIKPVENFIARKQLSDDVKTLRHRFEISGHKGYIHVGLFEDGTPGELFIRMAKAGSVINGLMDNFGIAVSLGLQHGVPLEAFTNKFIGTKFEPFGWTTNEDIQMAKSLLDYIFRWLKIQFEDKNDSIESMVESITTLSNSENPLDDPFEQGVGDGPPCPQCGYLTVPNGACYKCTNCGSTTGCS